MNLPYVSVIVPAYNAETTIGRCIESLLSQTYPADQYEILVVDNKSKDNTKEIIRKYPVTYLFEDAIQTAYASRNNGLRRAKGTVIAFTDSDCIIDKNWIEQGVLSLSEPNVIGAAGRIAAFEPETWIEFYQDRRGTHDQAHSHQSGSGSKKPAIITTANGFYHKKIFDELGLFDPHKKGGGDGELSVRIQTETSYKLAYNPKAIVYHKHSTTLRKLWEQFTRYGYSSLMILAQYDPQPARELLESIETRGTLKTLYWRLCFTGVFSNFKISVKNLFRYFVSFSAERKIIFIDSFLYAIERCAFFCGEWKSLKNNKELLIKFANRSADEKPATSIQASKT